MNRPLRLVLALAVLALPASATTYYVDRSHPAASNSNPGTEALPWLTIQHAADTLVAGNTVLVKAGTYPERVTITRSGAAGQEIVFAAYPGHTVTLDGTGITLPTWTGLIEVYGASWIRVRGFHVTHAGPGQANGIQVDSSSHVTIEQNHTLETASSGILVWLSSDVLLDGNEVENAMAAGAASGSERITVARTTGFEVRYNHVHHGNQARGEGIDAKEGSSLGSIHHNWVHHVPAIGIYLDSWDQPTHDIDVYANRVHDVAGNGFMLASEMGGLLSNVRVFDNLAYHNRWVGLTISDCCSASHPMSNVQVVNNSFWGNGWSDWGGGLHHKNPQATGVVIRNNGSAGNLSFELLYDGVPVAGSALDHNLVGAWHGYSGEVCGTDCQVGDPLWRDALNGDFHLGAGSPAIDHGSATAAPARDFDDRVRDALPDIGALERSYVKGDLDRDRLPDLLFRYVATGQDDEWLMNGSSRASLVTLSAWPASLDWRVVGVDDFDGDMDNDLVLWNGATGQVEFWLMNATQRRSAVPITGAPTLATNWRLSATGDFDHDQQPDLVWRNVTSQKIVVWTMNGTGRKGALIPVPDQAVDGNWEIVAALDYDGDGNRDFLWYNWSSGKIVQWLMNAAVQRVTGRFTSPASAGDANWKVLASADYGVGAGGLAGTNDVVWRNATSGRVVVWHLDLLGNRTSGLFTSPDAPGPDPAGWTIVGPR